MKSTSSKLILTFLVLVTCALGVIGFQQAFPQSSPFSHVYLAIQLFTLESGSAVETDIPWTLELARWLAAFISITAILLTLWIYLKRSAGMLKLSRLRNHSILFGHGTAVQSYLNNTYTNKQVKALVLIAANKTMVEHWETRGGLAILMDDAADSAITEVDLQKAGLEYAQHLVLLDTDDSANLRAALLAQSMSTCKGTKIIVRQDNPATRDLIQRNGLLSGDSDNSLRIISIETTRARHLLKELPLEYSKSHGQAAEVHLAIPGAAAFEQAVAVQAALIGHYPHGGKVHLWLDSREAESHLLSSYPGIVNCIHLHRVSEDGVASFADLTQTLPNGSALTILATDTTPEAGFVRGLHYRERWQARQSEIALKVILSGPLAYNADQHIEICAALNNWLYHVPTTGHLASASHLLDDRLDTLAAQIHHTWYDGNQAKIAAALAENRPTDAAVLRAKPTFKAWEQLTEHQKDSNRTAADHIEVKIRAVGLDPAQSDLLEVWRNLTAEQLDVLSRVEHERWSAPLWINGYIAGERNDALRKHPNLIPYDELDAGTQAYDTDQVKKAAVYYTAALGASS